VGDIRRTAEEAVRALDVRDWNGRLGGDPADVALDVLVDHDIPDNPDGESRRGLVK
jgi:hypothetical protein